MVDGYTTSLVEVYFPKLAVFRCLNTTAAANSESNNAMIACHENSGTEEVEVDCGIREFSCDHGLGRVGTSVETIGR
jgi:hypothetical protein